MIHVSNPATDYRFNKAVILIPAFNEELNVGTVVRDIRETTGLPVIVIDDASTDGTIVEAEAAGAQVIPLPTQLGAWGATQTGLRYAQIQDYDYAITMDADGQHQASSVAALIRPVVEGESDVTIGACTERGSPLRRVAWVLMKQVSGLQLEDVTSGFRAYNRSAVRILAGWRATLLDYQDIGVLQILQANGMTIKDIQVTMRPREHGSSRVFHSWLIVAYYMCSTLLLGLTKRRFMTAKRTRSA